MSALAAAATLAEISGWSLTNLQLQKLLYLAQMFHIGAHGSPIFSEDFEAWKLGPVQPAVYRKAKMFGGRPIETLFTPERIVSGSGRDCIEQTYRDLGGLPASKLVSMTHWSKGAWAKNYDGHDAGSTIPKSDMLAEYNERVRLIRERNQAR
ncbi:hypothetical protein GCM10007897_42590 [Sphingobium jiangsuense]|uniref:Putative phage-associated protein n=1 Tax=Sphingobium jiangsuense TaxID=870476 RepID=A0A7W6BPE7_9SPHN|nr:type II toxin-antitoxin system antitoxin SocA domain-containing protein [Sphingobium jiangsuense]MBB3928922.1 putative phage-associated protein [Sphingobium jiangsuense]GLT02835.1 hypothetical protein GCM10007897_42590 [Sphingobium jiangsuense]